MIWVYGPCGKALYFEISKDIKIDDGHIIENIYSGWSGDGLIVFELLSAMNADVLFLDKAFDGLTHNTNKIKTSDFSFSGNVNTLCFLDGSSNRTWFDTKDKIKVNLDYHNEISDKDLVYLDCYSASIKEYSPFINSFSNSGANFFLNFGTNGLHDNEFFSDFYNEIFSLATWVQFSCGLNPLSEKQLNYLIDDLQVNVICTYGQHGAKYFCRAGPLEASVDGVFNGCQTDGAGAAFSAAFLASISAAKSDLECLEDSVDFATSYIFNRKT